MTNPNQNTSDESSVQANAAATLPPHLPFKQKRRLVNLLLTKSAAELLFVCALAVGAHYAAFNPKFRGWSETAGRGIAGWVIDESSPTKRVEVQIYVDDSFVASRIANLPRPDVVAAGRARDALNGFHFDLPTLPAGEHEARVYAVHESGAGARRTLQLIGRPIRFRVEAEQR